MVCVVYFEIISTFALCWKNITKTSSTFGIVTEHHFGLSAKKNTFVTCHFSNASFWGNLGISHSYLTFVRCVSMYSTNTIHWFDITVDKIGASLSLLDMFNAVLYLHMFHLLPICEREQQSPNKV